MHTFITDKNTSNEQWKQVYISNKYQVESTQTVHI